MAAGATQPEPRAPLPGTAPPRPGTSAETPPGTRS